MSTGKFKPKIPVRRQEEEKKKDVAPPAPPKPANKSNNDKRGGGRGHKPRGAGAGRGHFLQPTGKAFFTGGGVTSASSAQPTISVSESSTSSAPVKSEDKVRGSGGYGISAQLRGINEEDDFDTREENMSIDSDEEGDAGCADKGTRGRVAEVWPPVEHSSSLPLALPFGPRSQNRRQQLLTQSLFAHPDDTAALSAEERSDMFLLQLPSSLLTPLPTSEPATAEVQKKLASGYIGKLQIMKSGRVFLVLSKERYASSSSAGDEVITRYEIASGIPSTTKQVAAAIDSSSATQDSTSEGGLYMLGSITKKAVVTPDFDSKIAVENSNDTSAGENQGHTDLSV